MNKDIIFTKVKEVRATPNEFDLSFLEDYLINGCLEKGYLPTNIKSGYYSALLYNKIGKNEFDYAICECAYVGKKKAPLLWLENKEQLYGTRRTIFTTRL